MPRYVLLQFYSLVTIVREFRRNQHWVILNNLQKLKKLSREMFFLFILSSSISDWKVQPYLYGITMESSKEQTTTNVVEGEIIEQSSWTNQNWFQK